MDKLLLNGFPDKKNEKYKYTFLTPLFEKPFAETSARVHSDISLSLPFLSNGPAVFLVNGAFFSSRQLPFPCESIRTASSHHPDVLHRHLGKYTDDDAFVLMNASFFREGLFLHIPPSTRLQQPVMIHSHYAAERTETRHLIVVEDNSEVTFCFFENSANDVSSLSHGVAEMYVGKNSRVHLIKVQQHNENHRNIFHTYIHQEEGSQMDSFFVSLQGGLIRNNFQLTMAGPHAEHRHYGLLVAAANHVADHYTFVKHETPACFSNQLIKEIIKDNATGIFYGKIYVCPHAQKTEAYQRNDNLLLDSGAVVNARPQLEIYADDVKCSHGDTVGYFADESLFYLRSRGIPEAEAIRLLVQGYASEIINQIQPEECRNWLEEQILLTL